MAETSRDDRAYRAVIYAVNQKGRGPRIALKDFIVGDSNIINPGKKIHFYFNFSLHGDGDKVREFEEPITEVTGRNYYKIECSFIDYY